MDDISVALFLLGLAGLLVAAVAVLVRVVLKRGWDFKKCALAAGISLGAIVVAVALAPPAMQETSQNKETATQETAVEEQPQSSGTPLDEATQQSQAQLVEAGQPISQQDYKAWLEDTVKQAVGAETNIGKPRICDVGFVDKEKTKVYLTLWADDNLTLGLVKTGLLVQSTILFRKIFEDPRASEVTLDWRFPARDAYGKEVDAIAMIVRMSRKTADKINWSGFSYSNLPIVADHYRVHKDLR